MVAKIVETPTARLHRLARQAQDRGIRIYRVDSTEAYLATSLSQLGVLHAVTPDSCDCPGHGRHGVCTHRAALLAFLGMLPTDVDPDSTPPSTALPVPIRTSIS